MHDGQRHFVQRAQAMQPLAWLPASAAHIQDTMLQDSGHDWAHLTRVLNAARVLWEVEGAGADWPVIAGAVLFHDVVNLPKDDPRRKQASTMAAQVACDWAAGQGDWGFDARQLALLEEAIRCHSYSSGFVAQSLEAQIVSDADRIDALGAFGIARTFAVGGALGRALAHPVDPLALEREPDDGVWSVDHFFIKLFRLPERMYTSSAKRLAHKRIEMMRGFLDVMQRELSGEEVL